MANEEREEMLAAGTITVKRAGEKYGIPRSSLYEAMQRGELAFTHFGKRRLIVEKSLLAMLAKGLVAAEAV